MISKDWDTFFQLIDKMTEPGKSYATWQERRAKVLEKAEENNSTESLAEFVTWFGGETENEDSEGVPA